jgi:hypothetical protein
MSKLNVATEIVTRWKGYIERCPGTGQSANGKTAENSRREISSEPEGEWRGPSPKSP